MADKEMLEARAALKARFAGGARTGGKGTVRRKKAAVHKTTSTDDKKLTSVLKRLGVNTIPGIEEVSIFKDDGSAIVFQNPKVQAAIGSNTYVVSGSAENKTAQEVAMTTMGGLGGLGGLAGLAGLGGPGGLSGLGPEQLKALQAALAKGGAGLGALGGAAGGAGIEDDDVPELEGTDFEATSDAK